MKQIVFRFGLLATALMVLMQLSKYSLFARDLTNEIFSVFIACLLIGFGVLVGHILRNKQKTEAILLNQEKAHQLDLSKREYEVLIEMVDGKSNKEIAETLFISESTVKTHVSNLFIKLDAKRRTEAIHKARNLDLI
ncbi:response regulator transcription factor [Fulvivirga sp. M361]|uniref:helix-turn-helix transcriptional regulator n=1 Tax=Fulvivirga sp. M361 TaxID=2594266 RepID=UPI00272E0F94|nr:response regulator transcription factor [Fulvivirga sp. M361]